MEFEIGELADLAGFTEYEKEVYDALYILGESSVKDLARKSSVPKPKVYSVLESLHEEGFVALENKNPKTYSVLPPKVAFKHVLDQKRKELENMEKLVDLADRNTSEEQDDKFLKMIKGRDTVLEFLAERLEETKEEYVTVGRFVSSYTPLQPVMKQKEDLDMRFIGPEEQSKDYVVEKYRNLGLSVRTVEMEEIPFRFSIYDNKHLALTLSDKEDGYTTVWTNYPSMVKNMREFFNFYWEQR